jgi:signal transduction histidine kinase
VKQEWTPDLPPVLCDAGMLSQVAMNLLVNAAQAIPDKGEVRIATRREGRHAVFEVEDNGTGMTPEVMARIFDPFFTTKDKGNTGLGLSISFKIVREHEGDISVRSTPGKGTTFTVRIPIDAKT